MNKLESTCEYLFITDDGFCFYFVEQVLIIWYSTSGPLFRENVNPDVHHTDLSNHKETKKIITIDSISRPDMRKDANLRHQSF